MGGKQSPEKRRAYYLANQEKFKARAKENYHANPEPKREYSQSYYLAHSEEASAQRKDRYQKNKPKERAQMRRYYRDNRQECLDRVARYKDRRDFEALIKQIESEGALDHDPGDYTATDREWAEWLTAGGFETAGQQDQENPHERG